MLTKSAVQYQNMHITDNIRWLSDKTITKKISYKDSTVSSIIVELNKQINEAEKTPAKCSNHSHVNRTTDVKYGYCCVIISVSPFVCIYSRIILIFEMKIKTKQG